MPLGDGTSRVDSPVNDSLPRNWCRKFGRSIGVIPHVGGIFRTNADEAPAACPNSIEHAPADLGKVHASRREVVRGVDVLSLSPISPCNS